jgi:hypothetical protein
MSSSTFLVKRLGIFEQCLDYMSLRHVVRAVCQWPKWAVPVMMRSLIHCQRFFCHSLFVIHFLLQVNTLSQKSSWGQCDRDVPSLCGAQYLDSLTILLFFACATVVRFNGNPSVQMPEQFLGIAYLYLYNKKQSRRRQISRYVRI